MALQIPRKPVSSIKHTSIAETTTQKLSTHNFVETNDYEEIPEERDALSENPSEFSPPSPDLKPLTIPPSWNQRHVKRYPYVKWGISWQGPIVMIAPACCAIALALGHHFYYTTLNNTVTGTTSHQQWALRFGNAFTIAIVVLLKASCDAVYCQYIWMIFKRKPLPLSTIDALFSLTSNPISFFSFKLLRSSTIAIFLALIPWLMALAGLTPPATLSIALGNNSEIQNQTTMSLNWTSTSFYDGEMIMQGPSPKILKLALQVAQQVTVLPTEPIFPNSSYSIQFYGPSVKCSVANSSEQSSMDSYFTTLAHNIRSIPLDFTDDRLVFYEPTLTKSSFESLNSTFWFNDFIASHHANFLGASIMNMAVLSAFAPYESLDVSDFRAPCRDLGSWFTPNINSAGIDQFNNWNVTIPLQNLQAASNWVRNCDLSILPPNVTQQIWIQTSTQSSVCTLGNVSYNVDLESVNGLQVFTRYQTSDFKPISLPYFPYAMNEIGSYLIPVDKPILAYLSWFIALTSLLSGNITTTITNENLVILSDSSSNILETGLGSCDDIINNWFQDNPITSGMNSRPVLAPSNITIINDIFDNNSSGMCRNHTLINAIEDLANNITISMLSDADLTFPNSTIIPVTIRTTRNIYHYDKRNLLLSYYIALSFTLLSILFGLYSLHINGVAHSSSFSALIATTRNTDLDSLSKGLSLGSLPGDKDMGNVRLRFGVLIGNEKNEKEEWKGDKHIGFGLENTVVGMEKGGVYI